LVVNLPVYNIIDIILIIGVIQWTSSTGMSVNVVFTVNTCFQLYTVVNNY